MTSARFIAELPQHNSDREGTLVDIRLSLERLMHVSTTIFDRIERRIEEESAKIEALDDRISVVKQRIAVIASQPSQPVTLVCVSKLPPSHRPAAPNPSLFADFPLQKLGEGESDESRFRNRKNADEDEDPVVPREALVELDRRLANSVALRVRNVLEQTRGAGTRDVTRQRTWYWPSSGFANNNMQDYDEDDVLGPPPPSLQDVRYPDLQTTMMPAGERSVHAGPDVAYKPRTKEAHQLGLPTSLGGFLPDIAEPATIFKVAAPTGKPGPSRSSGTGSKTDTAFAKSESVNLNVSIMSGETADVRSSAASVFEADTATVIESSKANEPAAPGLMRRETIETERPVAVSASSTQPTPPVPLDEPRIGLLAAIRQGAALKSTKREPASTSKSAKGTGPSPSKAKRPVSLADEMREKLARRQKALSGERDEEEQQAERRRKGREETWDEQSSDSGSSLPSMKSALLAAPAARKRGREPAPTTGMAFAGLDALLNRELAKKGPMVSKPPPKPGSSAGDWDDD